MTCSATASQFEPRPETRKTPIPTSGTISCLHLLFHQQGFQVLVLEAPPSSNPVVDASAFSTSSMFCPWKPHAYPNDLA